MELRLEGSILDASPPRMLQLEERSLLDACRSGDQARAALLITRRSESTDSLADLLDQADARGETPLLAAIRREHVDLAHMLLTAGAGFDRPDQTCQTPLLAACERGFAPLARRLLELGASISTRNVAGSSALLAAARNGREECVSVLLEHNAARVHTLDLDDCNRRGESPLRTACANGFQSIARLLLDARADPSRGDVRGLTPLMWACRRSQPACARELLLSASALVDQPTAQGETALMVACEVPHLELVQALLAHGAQVNAANKTGVTPLMVAARRESLVCVQLLLESGAHVDSVNKHATTALKLACCGSSLALVQCLCAYGASRVLPRGRLAHEVARQALGETDVVDWLARTQEWCSPLHHLEQLSLARTRELLEAGADVLARERPGGPTPLSLARELEARGCAPCASSAGLVLSAMRWSPRVHALFPRHLRARAVDLVRVGCSLSAQARFEGQGGALRQCWVEFVMPFAITRDGGR